MTCPLTYSLELWPAERSKEVITCMIEGKWPIRMLEMFVMVCTKELMEDGLVCYVRMVDPNEETNKLHYVNLFSKAAEMMGPTDLFVLLHRMESAVPLKRCVDVIQVCFVMPTVFKPDIIATGLQQLIDQPELPTMLMRTMLQSASHHKGLSSFLVGLLSRLLNREIWTLPKLWDGYIRCLRTLAPSSHAVMLQLPMAQLDSVLTAAPELRPGFITYLRQQSATIQGRYGDIDSL